jgi:hypothetical protein
MAIGGKSDSFKKARISGLFGINTASTPAPVLCHLKLFRHLHVELLRNIQLSLHPLKQMSHLIQNDDAASAENRFGTALLGQVYIPCCATGTLLSRLGNDRLRGV